MSMEGLAAKVWHYYKTINMDIYGITYPSIPVPYIGDYEAYKKSPIKIITAELNPSNKEFPSKKTFSRFYESETLYDKEELTPEETTTYLNSLNMYFNYNSHDWFKHIEPVLNAMNTSFYTGHQNTALHTYLLSPLATNKRWTKYEKTAHLYDVQEFTRKGAEMWLKLMDILQPDIILSSLGTYYRRRVFIEQKLDWALFETYNKTSKGKERRRPYEMHCTVASLPSGNKCLLAFGTSNVLPFMLSNEQKNALGRKIYKLFTGKEPIQYEITSKANKDDHRDIKKQETSLISRFVNDDHTRKLIQDSRARDILERHPDGVAL